MLKIKMTNCAVSDVLIYSSPSYSFCIF